MQNLFWPGENIYLRPLEPWDAQVFSEDCREVTLGEYPRQVPLLAGLRSTNYLKEAYDSRRDVVLGVARRADDRLAGAVGLLDINWVQRRAVLAVAMNWPPDTESMVDGVRTIVDYAFGALGLHRIEARTPAPLAPVLAPLLRASGFRLEVVRRLRSVFAGPGGMPVLNDELSFATLVGQDLEEPPEYQLPELWRADWQLFRPRQGRAPAMSGKRVELRPFSAKDDRTRWHNDPELTALMSLSFPMSSWAQRAADQDNYGAWPPGSNYVFSIWTDRFVGTVNLYHVNPSSGTAELGIMIGDKEQRGVGYGEEALDLAMGFGYQYLGLNRIELHVNSFNKAAIRLYRKKMMEEGTRREYFFRDRKYWGQIAMAALRKGYESLPGFAKYELRI